MVFFLFVIIVVILCFVCFILVVKFLVWGGEKYVDKICCLIELIGWGIIVLVVVVYIIY